ncbi:hypothetical protein [Tunicatimonas pelagia]|uniref:hypothetical protein n=1 Tax=Tunicatimonas pelagia TaxID=931531 RepID=UPI0026650845|nr:hypothetical protein [Tunicatimonas pelagia]WKN42228.1 hypothetical protein P0M28_24630 [Tunicatimonas pelagia]
MANDYNKIIKENIEAVILPLTHRLFQLEIKLMEEVPDELQVTLERKPDFLKHITTKDDRNFILHIEFQSANDSDMVYRMLGGRLVSIMLCYCVSTNCQLSSS